MSQNNILVPTGMDMVTGQFKIAGKADVLMTPAPVGFSNPPTLTMGPALGIGGTQSVTMNGTNTAGTITLVSGTLSLVAGKVMTLSFADGFTWPTGCSITFSPANNTFSTVYTRLYAQTYADSIELYTSLALSLSTTYIGHYKIEGW